MILRFAMPMLANLMGVVEANQPLAIRSMQGQRIIEPMRLLLRYGTRLTLNWTQ